MSKELQINTTYFRCYLGVWDSYKIIKKKVYRSYKEVTHPS
jgi:hypothetical protein